MRIAYRRNCRNIPRAPFDRQAATLKVQAVEKWAPRGIHSAEKFENRLLGPTNIEFLPEGGHRACRLRAVNAIKSAFYGLGCHLSPCMSLELRFFVDSIPSALTISFQ